jgi:hypothetical protein
MKVKWTERMSASHWENVQGMFPDEADPSDFDNEREGEVIGSNKSFWGDTYLVVACTDDKIREVEMKNVRIIK